MAVLPFIYKKSYIYLKEKKEAFSFFPVDLCSHVHMDMEMVLKHSFLFPFLFPSKFPTLILF